MHNIFCIKTLNAVALQWENSSGKDSNPYTIVGIFKFCPKISNFKHIHTTYYYFQDDPINHTFWTKFWNSGRVKGRHICLYGACSFFKKPISKAQWKCCLQPPSSGALLICFLSQKMTFGKLNQITLGMKRWLHIFGQSLKFLAKVAHFEMQWPDYGRPEATLSPRLANWLFWAKRWLLLVYWIKFHLLRMNNAS